MAHSPSLKILKLCLILIELAHSFMLLDSSLDPGRILWPKETWVSNPIQLSQTNAGSYVTFTFNFRPSTTLNDGLLEVIFPSSIPTDSPSHYLSSSFEAGKDISLEIGEITLPEYAGIYGPFGLITRSLQTGQIYDVNNVFGYIAITNIITTSTLIVTNSALNPVVGSSDTLFFTFSLNQNLWKGDLIEIVPSNSYKPSSSVTCSSVTVAGEINILYGPAGDYNLPCTIAAMSSSKTGPQSVLSDYNSIYIYGISENVYLASSSLIVKLSISTFIYPSYKLPSTSNTWKVNIWKMGTSTLIAQYTTASGPTTPIEGIINVTWLPINNALNSVDVISGMDIFTKVTFTTQNDIPAGGTAEIIFSGVEFSRNWWEELDESNGSGFQCYLTTPINGASCRLIGLTTILITFTNNQVAGSVSIALLTHFSSESIIEQIVTKNSVSFIIDSTSIPTEWTDSLINVPFYYFKFHSYTPASSNSYPLLEMSNNYSPGTIYGANQNYDLFFAFKSLPEYKWSASTIVEIYLPFTQSGISFTQPYIGLYATQYEMDNGLKYTDTVSFISPAINGSYVISENKITISFLDNAPSEGYYVVAFGNGHAALPYVASNLGTFYECFAISYTSGIKEIWNSVYSVLVQDYYGNGIYTKPFCLNNNAPGIPLVSVFMAKLMTIDFSSEITNFALEIRVINGADLQTGIGQGSLLPLSSSISTTTAVLFQIIGDTIIKIRGLGVVTTSTAAITTFLAMGKLSIPSLTTESSLYYTISSDPSLKNYLYKSTDGPYTLINSQVNALTSSGLSSSIWEINSPSALSINPTSVNSPVTSTYIGVGLPKGFSLSSAQILVGNVAASTIYSASNSNDYMSGGFIIGTSNNHNYKISTSSASILVTGLIAPGYSPPNNLVSFNIFGASSFGGNCEISASTFADGILYPGQIASSSVTCSLSSYAAAGADSVDSIMTIIVTTVNKIPKNGSISLTLNSAWTFDLSSCTVLELSDIDLNHKVACSISSCILTINSFAAFAAGTITISISHILPPLEAGIYDCVTEVHTQDENANIIDYGSGLSQNIIINIPAEPVRSI